KYVDPDGRTDYIYHLDENGNKTVTEENDWGKFEFLHIDRYFVETSDGTRCKANSKETVTLHENWKNIDTDFLHGTLSTLLSTVNQKDTDFTRILKQSVDGELDFKLSMKADTLYFDGNVLYNRNEAGNFVWAYFLESKGFTGIHGVLAQAGSIVGSHRLDEWHDTKARYAGDAYFHKIDFYSSKFYYFFFGEKNRKEKFLNIFVLFFALFLFHALTRIISQIMNYQNFMYWQKNWNKKIFHLGEK
ncbi:hypothetical protein, partial [Treponema zioleckii]|uniref:hypothetical protein n=1 Tax=Treponema zioleckii TaxID=331680 RepID=UPI00168B2CD6